MHETNCPIVKAQKFPFFILFCFVNVCSFGKIMFLQVKKICNEKQKMRKI